MTEASNYRNADHPALDLTSLFGLSGKVAIVTGGSRGIGYMIAAGLVANGVKVYITARKAAACDAAAAELSEHGECISIPGDMSTPEGIDAFVAAVTAQEDQIDILVNNAGANWGAPLADYPDAGFAKVMDTNLNGTVHADPGAPPPAEGQRNGRRPCTRCHDRLHRRHPRTAR